MIVSVQDAETRLSELLDLVAEGEQIVISRRGKPMARLVPVRARRRVLGAMRGEFDMVEGWERAPSDDDVESF